MSDPFEQRRQWFATYINHVRHGSVKPPQEGVHYPCPCCGYPTLAERGGYAICELCNWEDDGQDDPHADAVWGGPNGAYSLAAARSNFHHSLSMYDPERIKARQNGGDRVVEQQAKRAVMAAFDAMVGVSDPIIVERCWKAVRDNERLLRRERHRKRCPDEDRRQTDSSAELR